MYKLLSLRLAFPLALSDLHFVITRGARFFLVAGALNLWGDRLRHLLEKYFGLFLVVLLISVIGGFWLAAHMF